MRKGRRVNEKGSIEGREKETKRQFEEKEGRRDPPLLEFLDLTLPLFLQVSLHSVSPMAHFFCILFHTMTYFF